MEVNGDIVKVCHRCHPATSIAVYDQFIQPRLDPEHPVMGSALHIPLPFTRAGGNVSVKVAYKTTEESPALLWLEKEYVTFDLVPIGQPPSVIMI